MLPRERLRAEARLLASWSALLSVGVEEQAALEALGEVDLGVPSLTAFARAGASALAAGRPLASAVDDAATLSFWVQVLLATEARDPVLLERAARLLLEDAEGPGGRGRVWAKLRLLHAAGGRVGDGFGALAREAREAGFASLAEGLYAAARAGRQGSDLAAALRAVGGLNAVETLCVQALDRDVELTAVLDALETLGLGEGGGASSETTLEGVVQAATETAAPIKRGLTGLLSKVEDALGIDRAPSPRETLARETLQARSAPEPAPAAVAEDDGAPSRVERAESDARPARKTIGGDSGPVRVGRLPDTPLEAWVLAFEEATAKQALLDVQPGEAGVARELRQELASLRADLRGDLDTPRRRAQLDELTGRFEAWSSEHAE